MQTQSHQQTVQSFQMINSILCNEGADFIYSNLYLLITFMSNIKTICEHLPTSQSLAVTPIKKHEDNNGVSNNINKASGFGDQAIIKSRTESLLILQRAEIQRLTGAINQYKCKLNHINLENLDRKSYELQIDELFQNNNKNKFQIEKLNTSIKSLVSSNEKYRKQLFLANQKVFQLEAAKRQLHEKSENLKFQKEVIVQDFKSHKTEAELNLQKIQKQLLFHKSYKDSLKASNQDLLKRLNSIPNYQSKIFELQKSLQFYRSQNEQMKDELARYKQKILNVERNHSVLYEKHNAMEKEHQLLKEIHEQVQSKLSVLQGQSSKYNESEKIDHQSKFLSSKESKKIGILSDQIKTLNLRNEKTVTTCKALTDINNKLKQQNKAQEIELKNLKIILSDYQKKLNDSLGKNSLFIHQSNKYQAQLQSRISQNEKKISALVTENEKLKKEILGYQKMVTGKIAQSEYLKRKLIEVENDLKEQFQNSFQQQKKSLIIENAGIQKRNSLKNLQSSQKTQLIKAEQLNQLKPGQEQALKQEIQSENLQIQKLQQQLHQLSLLLNNKTIQNEKLKHKFFTLQQEFKTKIEQTIKNLKTSQQQKQQLLKKQNQHKEAYSKLQSEFISIQLLIGELKQERTQLLKKNALLIKGIKDLNHEIKIIHEGAEKISSFFTKDSSIHQSLEKHYSIVQQIFNLVQIPKQGEQIAQNLQTSSNV